MGIEMRPLGVACNLACHYCYQNPQREAGSPRAPYDLDKMKAEALRIGGPFTLFGGEPLLMRFEDLENLFSWGFEKHGGSSIQSNGILMEERHIDLFRRYKVAVGISIDGPGELNDARWHRSLKKTRASTAKVEAIIEQLCREYEAPGLIVTLHRGNASPEKIPQMIQWVRRLYGIGIRSARLHLLEVDDPDVRQSLALSPRENIQALLAFAEAQSTLPGLHFDLFEEIEALLEGQDGRVGCTWRACDPYTTEAVQGIEGNGQSSNCGRTNKDGVGFIKAQTAGYERYVALYGTPQAEKGCQGCRFFLMCKGQCPGTAVDGDWRNRTEHCEEWKYLFRLIERQMILAGKVPLTIQPLRLDLERMQVQAWKRGENPSLNRLVKDWYNLREHGEGTPQSEESSGAQSGVRVSWVSERSREIWEERLPAICRALEDMTIHAASPLTGQCAVRLVPRSAYFRLERLASDCGLATAMLPAQALPEAINTQPGEADAVTVLAGAAPIVGKAHAAWSRGDLDGLKALLALPHCCLGRAGFVGADEEIPATVKSHALLSPLGISILPIKACHFDCQAAQSQAEQWMELAAARGLQAETRWLRECLSWPVLWSEHHGIVEVKTPSFRLCLAVASATSSRSIRRLGASAKVEGAGVGLHFPYLPPAPASRLVQIGAN